MAEEKWNKWSRAQAKTETERKKEMANFEEMNWNRMLNARTV